MNDKPQGAGLGLAISQRIVAQHGGLIWVESGPEGGAAFKVRLKAAPRSKGKAAGRHQPASAD